ncbi:hypothetical protein ZWY2020_026920 [Hordeum vulgare]|nr:hypothetical protein ZWY2020_026920 [Hordeum vulgare]
MGNMVLLDKEAEGMVFVVLEPGSTTKVRWAVVGKSCSSGPLNLAVVERTMQRAWGLHKEYDGGTRPSEMVFDKVEMWVQVHDLPPDKRMEEFGNALGSWLGKVVRVDVDEEGKAKGDSRTGEENRPGGKDVRSPINSRGIAKEQHERDLRYDLEQKREEVLRGKLVEQ